jgi:hypothetical protein
MEGYTGWDIFLYGSSFGYRRLKERNEHMFVCGRCHYVFYFNPKRKNWNWLFVSLLFLVAVAVAVLLGVDRH